MHDWFKELYNIAARCYKYFKKYIQNRSKLYSDTTCFAVSKSRNIKPCITKYLIVMRCK